MTAAPEANASAATQSKGRSEASVTVKSFQLGSSHERRRLAVSAQIPQGFRRQLEEVKDAEQEQRASEGGAPYNVGPESDASSEKSE
jgi:hypothetical protein